MKTVCKILSSFAFFLFLSSLFLMPSPLSSEENLDSCEIVSEVAQDLDEEDVCDVIDELELD